MVAGVGCDGLVEPGQVMVGQCDWADVSCSITGMRLSGLLDSARQKAMFSLAKILHMYCKQDARDINFGTTGNLHNKIWSLGQ